MTEQPVDIFYLKLKSREEFSRRSLFKKGSKLLKKKAWTPETVLSRKGEQYPSLKWETDYTFQAGYLLVPPNGRLAKVTKLW